MRKGPEVRTCSVSSPHVRKNNLFHELILMIQTLWENFCGSVLSTALNYFQNMVHYLDDIIGLANGVCAISGLFNQSLKEIKFILLAI